MRRLNEAMVRCHDKHSGMVRTASKVLTAVSAAVIAGTLVYDKLNDTTAPYSANGLVSCTDGRHVVAVWIDAGKDSGYADLDTTFQSGVMRFSRSIGAISFSAHVGCNFGNSGNWETANYSPPMPVNVTNNVECTPAAAPGSPNQRGICTLQPLGAAKGLVPNPLQVPTELFAPSPTS